MTHVIWYVNLNFFLKLEELRVNSNNKTFRVFPTLRSFDFLINRFNPLKNRFMSQNLGQSKNQMLWTQSNHKELSSFQLTKGFLLPG